MPSTSLTNPYLWIGAAAAVLWCVGIAIALRRRDWMVAFCLICFGIFYGLIADLISIIGVDCAERLMYIPSIFFVILLARLIATLRRPLMLTAVCIIITLYSVRTVSYAWQWNDRLRLYQSALIDQPSSLRLHLLLAEELRLRGDFGRSAAVLAEARALQPDYFRLWLDSAITELASGNRVKAREYIMQAANLRPSIKMTRMYRDLLDPRSTSPTTTPSINP
jgi:hypothetical protein